MMNTTVFKYFPSSHHQPSRIGFPWMTLQLLPGSLSESSKYCRSQSHDEEDVAMQPLALVPAGQS